LPLTIGKIVSSGDMAYVGRDGKGYPFKGSTYGADAYPDPTYDD